MSGIAGVTQLFSLCERSINNSKKNFDVYQTLLLRLINCVDISLRQRTLGDVSKIYWRLMKPYVIYFCAVQLHL